MQLVYYAHSYREEDARITGFFLAMLTRNGLTPSLDPPSDRLNSAKLERHVRSSDGLVAILTERATGTSSPYIQYEILLAVRSRKPILVFVEDSLPGDVVPPWITQRRFSRRFYGRQVRELRAAINEFRSYLGDDPPARYGAHTSRRSCVITGFGSPESQERQAVEELVISRGYESIDVDSGASPLWREPLGFSRLSDIDLAVCDMDDRTIGASYLSGVIHSGFVPAINVSEETILADWVPSEFAPCRGHPGSSLVDAISAEIDVFEQDFLDVDDVADADRYIDGLIAADAYRTEMGAFTTSGVFFMGDQINIDRSQVGAVGDHAVVSHNTFEQTWNEVQSDIDLARLAEELQQLRTALSAEPRTASEAAALGEAAQAEIAASEGDGPTALKRLQAAGQWLLTRAEEIGVPVAIAALSAALAA